jgi:hypothetical protein
MVESPSGNARLVKGSKLKEPKKVKKPGKAESDPIMVFGILCVDYGLETPFLGVSK